MPEPQRLHAAAPVPPHRHRPLPWRTPLTLLTTACLAAACAQLPDAPPKPQLKATTAFASSQSLRAPQVEWPADAWWTAYGDPQLNALIDEALQGAPDLLAAQARLQRAEAFTQLAGSALQPQLSANAGISADKLSYNHLVPRSPATEGWNDYGRATLDFRWEMDFWGKNRAGLSAATSELDAHRAELAQTRLLLASGIASDYAELGHLFARRELAQKSVAIHSQTAQLLAQRQASGLETRGSVHAADAARAAAEGTLLAADEQIALQRNRLAAWLGEGPDRGLSITPPQLQLNKAFGLPAHLSADLLGRRPDVTAARLMAQAQASRIEEKQAGFYPSVNLSAFIGVQALGLDLLGRSGSSVGSVGPAISLPIFNGGRLRGELRGAQAAYAESVARYHATVARALQDVADAAVSQKALAQRLDKAQEAVTAATQAQQLSRQRREGGLATAMEVLMAEGQLLESLAEQTHLRAQSLRLDIALQRALGGSYQAPPSTTDVTSGNATGHSPSRETSSEPSSEPRQLAKR